ncbi:MOSC domain-containing protein [Kordiimonas lipolytica]|uniref:MOSC domain-containing protein n=1 Tax=Kordiimonas lipolytica TaxID=1662421 RepID=A0ABV8UEA6_9PROT|nr:MOSC domain-containing protein [Kordiimonas lipolytica]
MTTIAEIWRYPVKGLTGQRLETAQLEPGGAIAGDRAFAIRHGNTEFDPGAPKHLPKTKFLALMTHAELAALEVSFSGEGDVMTVSKDGELLFHGSLRDPDEVHRLDIMMATYMGDRAKGAPHLESAEGHMFSDVPEKVLSVVNLASVKALGTHVGEALDPLRFRANLYLDGLPAWAERDWEKGRLFTAGDVTLRLMKPIVRCNATNVNLKTAEVDQNLPKVLQQEFGANLMGIYCTVERAGVIKLGDPFMPVD